MHDTGSGTNPSAPGGDAIFAALADAPISGTAPVLLTLLDTPPRGLVAHAEATDPEMWRAWGIQLVLHAFAEALRRDRHLGRDVAGYALALPAAGIAYAVDRGGARRILPLPGRTRQPVPDLSAEVVLGGLATMVDAVLYRRGALLVGSDAALCAELTTLAPGLPNAQTATAAAAAWPDASLVIVTLGAIDACWRAGLPAPQLLIVLAPDGSDPWQAAARLAATHVAFWPTCRGWLADRLAEHRGAPT